MRRILIISLVTCAAALMAVQAKADEVNFEDQPAGSSTFGAPAQTLVYNFGGLTATFSGGTILTDETSQSTDDSNVYATASFGSGDTNPLVITFNQAIQNFQIEILNAIAGSYTMSDNAGHSLAFSLATTGGSLATEGFAATGTKVSILFNGPPDGFATYDFAIDNVTFDQPLSGVPEPGELTSLGAGLLALFAAVYLGKNRVARRSAATC
jgi:hypothetical protein